MLRPVLSLLWILANQQLIHDETASRSSTYGSYDFIIIGAGSAGCTIAHRLTENPNVNVLLLEAGGGQSAVYNDIPALFANITQNRPDLQWLYLNEPQMNAGKQYPGHIIPDYMGKTIGGSSTHNNMIFNRGNAKDYDNWAINYGAKGWSFREVLPFFKMFENNTDPQVVAANPGLHGTNGPIQVTSQALPGFYRLIQKAYNELGIENTDFNGAKQTGTMAVQSTIDSRGLRSSNSNAYVDPNPHPKNLHILTNALVTKIVFNGLVAVGVEFAKYDKLFRIYAEKEVILTAGPFNSPQLLMLSGIGPRDHLKAMGIPVRVNAPVGNNHKNHPQITIRSTIIEQSLIEAPPSLDNSTLNQVFQSGQLSQNPTNGLYFNSNGDNSADWPNTLMYTSVSNDTLEFSYFLARVRSRGTVRLMSSSPFVVPRIDPALLADPQDFNDVVDGVRFAFYLLEKSSIAPYVRPPLFEDIGCPVCTTRHKYECTESIKCFIRYFTTTGSHSCCGCRMGDIHRKDVVVDPSLRVKNVFKLRVCDSSIFPELPNGNLNSPTTMVAEKCASLIKKTHRL